MKKIITLFVLILITYSCNKKADAQKEAVKNEFSFFNTTEPIAEIDFNLSNEELLKSIESQLNKDICNISSFTGKIKVNNKTILFPIQFLDHCNSIARYTSIHVVINKRNHVLIKEKIFSEKENIEEKLISESKFYLENFNNPNVFYKIKWDTGLDHSITSKRIYQILKSIKSLSNEISRKEFDKELHLLNDSELFLLNQKFKGIISISGKQDPIPVPPMIDDNY